MNCFQNVKYGVSCREAAEQYGVDVPEYRKIAEAVKKQTENK